MIYNKVDAAEYKKDFAKRFENYGNKAPIMISFAIDDFEVTVVHENSGTQYKYPWDFTIPVKSFIHKIKTDLSYHHYPRICRKVEIVKNLTPEEQANLIAEGTSTDKVPVTKKEEVVETYRIDKILAMKDEFILINEETGEQVCYRMKGSGVYFLKKYREGGYKDPLEAGEAFFKKSELITKLSDTKIDG